MLIFIIRGCCDDSHFKSGTKSNAIFALPGHGSTSSIDRKSNAIFALPGHESTSFVSRKSSTIFALPGHGSTSSVSRKSNAIFALPGHGSTSSASRKSNAIFALPGHGSTSSVSRKPNAIFALSSHGSPSSVYRKSNVIFALPDHGSTSPVGHKSNAIFALPDHESPSSIGLYYTGSAFIIINPSHYPLVKNKREWYLANASVTPTIEKLFFLRGPYRSNTGNQASEHNHPTHHYPRPEKTTNGTRRVVRTGPTKLCFNTQYSATILIDANLHRLYKIPGDQITETHMAAADIEQDLRRRRSQLSAIKIGVEDEPLEVLNP
nr:hypothetical protein [Tanacetum cinerariifolium]